MQDSLIKRLKSVADHRSADIFCTFLADDEVHEIMFAELFGRAQLYAEHFVEEGLARGDVVFIVLRHRPDLLYAFVGALLAGCIPSILAPISEKQDPDTFWLTLRHLFEKVGATAAVIDPEDLSSIAAAVGLGTTKLMVPLGADAPIKPIEWPQPAPDDIAFLQFSSGTTGLRKGVMLTHRIVVEQIDAYTRAIAMHQHDRVASWLPLYHDMGLIACFVVPLAIGAPIVMLDAFDWVYKPERLFAAITDYRATLVWLPNFAFNHLCATVPGQAPYDLSSVRAFIDCSEPCKIESMRRFAHHFASMNARTEQLQTCYAMAEAVFAVTQSDVGRPPVVLAVDREVFETEHKAVQVDAGSSRATMEFLSVGRLLPEFDLRIVDSARRDVARGHIGEIAIRGPCLFSAYYRAPEATAAAFADGWYLTGDLGFVSGDQLYVTGRTKDIIIAYGKNYYSHDIETIVSGVAGVKAGRAVAFGVHNANSGSEDVVVVAETEQTDSKPKLVSAVRSAINAELGLTVSSVALVPPRWLIKTTSGKIGRAQSREKYLRMISEQKTKSAERFATS